MPLKVFLHLTESLTTQGNRIVLPDSAQAIKPHSSSGAALNALPQRHHLDVDRSASAQVIEH